MEHRTWSIEHGFDYSFSLKSIVHQRSGPRWSIEHGAKNIDLIIPLAKNPLSISAAVQDGA
jgi:hypothetical protein